MQQGLILANKPIRWASSCAVSRTVRVSPRVPPGTRTSLSCPNFRTTRSRIGAEGSIDGAAVGAGEGAAAGVGEGAGAGGGAGAVASWCAIMIDVDAGEGTAERQKAAK